jgi:hypothetical protein
MYASRSANCEIAELFRLAHVSSLGSEGGRPVSLHKSRWSLKMWWPCLNGRSGASLEMNGSYGEKF